MSKKCQNSNIKMKSEVIVSSDYFSLLLYKKQRREFKLKRAVTRTFYSEKACHPTDPIQMKMIHF